MRDLTRRIAAGFYRMGIGIGTEKTPVEPRARVEKNVGFLHAAGPLLVFRAPQECFPPWLALRAVQSDSIPEDDIAGQT
jgi:hypothetical protein